MQDTDCMNACRQLHLWANDNLVDLAMPASMQAANPTSLEFLARRVSFLLTNVRPRLHLSLPSASALDRSASCMRDVIMQA